MDYMETRNDVVSCGKQADLNLAMNTINFRVSLWFKNHGFGSKIDLTILMLDLNERCTDAAPIKRKRSVEWIP